MTHARPWPQATLPSPTLPHRRSPPRLLLRLLLPAALLSLSAVAGCATSATVMNPPWRTQVSPDVRITRLSEHVWMHTTWKQLKTWGRFPANGLIVAGPQGVVLVDAAWSPDQFAEVKAWVETHLHKPIVALVVTHAHNDRMGGASAAARHGIAIHGLKRTLALAPKQGFALPTQLLPDTKTTLRVAGVELQTLWPGHAHAPDNLLVWLPKSGVLFGGCLIKSVGAKTLGNLADADIAGWQRAMRRIDAQPWRPQWVVPGHGQPGGVALLRHTSQLLAQKQAEAPGTSAATADVTHRTAAMRPVETDRRVAITIDDLPVVSYGARGDAHREQAIVAGWCKQLKAAKAPATGFFNLKRLAPTLVAAWQACGIAVGNHTLSHLHPDKVPLRRYLADLSAGHAAVAKLVPAGTTIPFRYPYLRRGFDPKVHDAIRARLKALGSPVAPVTVETSDWWYAKRWFDANKVGDAAAAARYRQAWRWNLEESTLIAEGLAQAVVGRQPPQILLLHANEIGAHHIAGYLAWLKRRGYRFVTLAEALKDPVYARPVRLTSPTGDNHWLRLRREGDEDGGGVPDGR